MDMFEQSYQPNPNPPYHSRRSSQMESASLVLGLIAGISCTCLYLSIPCGALAIIFATLSRGGAMSYTSKAQIGMVLGILALVVITLLVVFVVVYAWVQYGSIEAFLEAYAKMQGMSYNELMQQFLTK